MLRGSLVILLVIAVYFNALPSYKKPRHTSVNRTLMPPSEQLVPYSIVACSLARDKLWRIHTKLTRIISTAIPSSRPGFVSFPSPLVFYV